MQSLGQLLSPCVPSVSTGRVLYWTSSVATKSFFFFSIISSPLRNKLPGEKLGVWDPSGCQYCPTDALHVEKSGTFSPQGSRQP